MMTPGEFFRRINEDPVFAAEIRAVNADRIDADTSKRNRGRYKPKRACCEGQLSVRAYELTRWRNWAGHAVSSPSSTLVGGLCPYLVDEITPFHQMVITW